MTPTERQYRKHLGQLFWSIQRQSLVMLTDLVKSYGRWRYKIEYASNNIGGVYSRTRDASEIEKMINNGRWITAAQFMKFREGSQAKKST